MKNLIITSIFSLISLVSFSQKLNFMSFGFYSVNITTNPKIKLQKLTNVKPTKDFTHWDGFNHYEVDLNKKVVIHCYVGEAYGEKLKIYNLITTKDYYSFDVKSKSATERSFLIPRNQKSKYNLLIKYKEGDSTHVALFGS
jgi:hypothetical protein